MEPALQAEMGSAGQCWIPAELCNGFWTVTMMSMMSVITSDMHWHCAAVDQLVWFLEQPAIELDHQLVAHAGL